MTIHELNAQLTILNQTNMHPNQDFYTYIIEPFYVEDIYTLSKREFAKFYVKHYAAFHNQYLVIKSLIKDIR